MTNRKNIYLDHAATSPVRPEVIQEMSQKMVEVYGNPSSIHSFGREAKKVIEVARQSVANSIGASSEEIIFTSGGTESDNLAILGSVDMKKNKGKHIITTQVEHPAVLNTMKHLEISGYEVTYLSVDEYGELSMDEFSHALREDTILVSIMYANNETGVVFPIEKVAEIISEHQALLHVDAVQAYGHVPINVNNLAIDLLSLSSHKVNGPKGTGALYIKNGIQIQPQLYGGEQERNHRPGTENVISLSGFGVASDFITEETIRMTNENYLYLQEKLFSELNHHGISYQVNGGVNKVPNIINLWLEGMESKLLVPALDIEGIAVSAGSACMAGDVHSSHVLRAMYGESSPRVTESIRISLGLGNTEKDIDRFVDALRKIRTRIEKI